MLCRMQSVSRDMCFGSSEREDYKSPGGNRHCLGKLCSAAGGAWQESSFPACLSLLVCAPAAIRSLFYHPTPFRPAHPALNSESLSTAPTSPNRDDFASLQSPLPQAEVFPSPFLPSASLRRLWSTLFTDTTLESCLTANRCDLISGAPLKSSLLSSHRPVMLNIGVNQFLGIIK